MMSNFDFDEVYPKKKSNRRLKKSIHNNFSELGAIFILRKDIGVGGWFRKWQFSLTLCSENVLT